MMKYNVSKSTIYFIKKANNQKITKIDQIQNIYEDIFGLNICEMREIYQSLEPPKYPLTIWDIQDKLKSKNMNTVSRSKLTKYIKNNLNYSFKKGSSTSVSGSSLKLKTQQVIFSCRILTEIFNEKYIVNIDESSFNRDLKMEYSWLPKGITSAIINQIYRGSKSMITAFWSDGEYIWVVLNENVNSSCFQDFLSILNYFLELRSLNSPNKTVVILDNAAYHSSKDTKDKMKNMNYNFMFLPPYSPILAPVEQYFKQIKAKMRSFKIGKPINFSSHEGWDQICRAWDWVKKTSLRCIWIDLIRSAMELISLYNLE